MKLVDILTYDHSAGVTFSGAVETNGPVCVLKANIDDLSEAAKTELTKMAALRAVEQYLIKCTVETVAKINIVDKGTFKTIFAEDLVDVISDPDDIAELLRVRYSIKTKLDSLPSVSLVHTSEPFVESMSRLMAIADKSVQHNPL